MLAYSNVNYGLQTLNPLLGLSAICGNLISVNATIGCDNNEIQCVTLYRPSCEFPLVVGWCVLGECVIIIITVLMSLIFSLLESGVGRGGGGTEGNE